MANNLLPYQAPASLRNAEEHGEELKQGQLSPIYSAFGATQLWVSDMGQLVADSGKMQACLCTRAL